jgi:hypothetical protein
MTAKRTMLGITFMVCFLQITFGLGLTQQAWADKHDLAMFHDSLAPYGKWIDYGKYGPVWHPNKVSSSWRPYLNGRWTPSHAGWVFETTEPWGWATYHYGNWMPTTDYGWVWSPGSTWYPSTAAWRTSDDYIGWAPIPPPDYAPEPAFYPAGGYNHEAPVLDALAAPLWIFVQAAQFLLGFGQPYAPAFSYYDSINSLAPLSYTPIVYSGTFPLTDFYYYTPGAFYSFGPPFPYVSRVTNVDIQQINNYINTYNYPKMRNVLPPPGLVQRYPYVREGIPSAILEGRRFSITRVQDVGHAEHVLNAPSVSSPSVKLAAPTGAIPKVTPSNRMVSPNNLGKIKGMAFPHQATQPLTTTMRQQIRIQRQMKGPPRVETRPEFRPLAKPEGVSRGPERVPQPATSIQPSPRTVQPSQALPPGHFQPAPSHAVRATPQPDVRTIPSRESRTPATEGFHPAPPREYRRPSTDGYHPAMPREFRAAPPPVFRSAPRPASQPAFHPSSPVPRGPAPGRPSPSSPGRPEHR